MKAAVLTFPGSNCDEDLRYALEISGFDVTNVWHKDRIALGDFQLVGVPGGFSFGDYLRCGAIASLSPILDSLKEFAGNGGKVIGICNGFQILCEAGLLPGSLAPNLSLKFVCKDVPLRVENPDTCWTRAVDTEIALPVAHGDGRYVADDQTVAALEERGGVLLRYLDNPNGSVGDIAGICNEQGNVFGLMPHPERATDLRTGQGAQIWKSVTGGSRG